MRNPRFKDFRTFLFFVWKHLGLPAPTEVQYDIAHFLQHGPERTCIEAFRGVGKSWITAAYVVWRLYWNPDLKILAVSQAKGHADDISTFILQIIHTVPGLIFLSPEGRDRKSKIAFDVGPARPSKQPSVKSVGITGQMTGSRADVILADDVESLNNSLTHAGRERIEFLTKEFDSILSPGGRIIYLGTPQTEQSIYNKLPDRQFTLRIWPAQYPSARLRTVYGDRLAPLIREAVENDPSLVDAPTDPKRFDALTLATKRAGYGAAGYALQFMLDTSLADTEKYPLKLRDLIVMSIHPDIAPEEIIWSCMDAQRLSLPSPGLGNDRFYGPLIPDKTQWSPYSGCVMFVDPAGTGADETAYAIVKHSHGRLFLVEATGLAGGYSDATMVTLASRAKVHKVNRILVEANFGDGMFTKLLEPHLGRIYPCTTEDVKVHTQKERRIIDVLEPVMAQHRLIVDQSVIEQDGHRDAVLPAETAAVYRLFFQMTRLTRDRGSLLKDDRIDAVAGAVAWWVESMAKDIEKSIKAARTGRIEDGLKEFMNGLLGKPATQPARLGGNAACNGVTRPDVRRSPGRGRR